MHSRDVEGGQVGQGDRRQEAQHERAEEEDNPWDAEYAGHC